MAAKHKLSVADIQRCFWVDETGTVRWKQSVEPVPNNLLYAFKDTVAGRKTAPTRTGVVYRRIRFTRDNYVHHIMAHVIAFVLHNGKFPEGDIDHANGNGLNNTGTNLRDVKRRVNMCNAVIYRNNRTGVKGVTSINRYPGKFAANAKINGKSHYLYEGYDFFEAVCARKSFEARNDHIDVAYSSQTIRRTNP